LALQFKKIEKIFYFWSKQVGSSNWDFAESIFPVGKANQGVLNKDPTVWLDGVRPPPLILLVLPLPENEFGKVIMEQHVLKMLTTVRIPTVTLI